MSRYPFLDLQDPLIVKSEPKSHLLPHAPHTTLKCDGTDLVRYIKKNYGSYFCTSVAGYPEGTATPRL